MSSMLDDLLYDSLDDLPHASLDDLLGDLLNALLADLLDDLLGDVWDDLSPLYPCLEGNTLFFFDGKKDSCKNLSLRAHKPAVVEFFPHACACSPPKRNQNCKT